MGTVRTILGDIDSAQMGLTLPHEHLLTRPVDAVMKTADEILMMDSVDAAVKILKDFQDAGGQTFVEMTPKTHGRNTPGMVRASKEVGAHVIATTGFISQKLGIPPNIEYIPINQLVDDMVQDVMAGMDGTEHKAGVVKAGTSYMKITSGEEKVLRAAARAALETGAPLHTHTDVGTMGLEQIEIVKQEGFDPGRMIIAHVDRNPDLWYHRKMLQQGVYLIYDGPGKAKYYPDSVRVELLRKLVDAGFEHKLMLSNDIGKRSYHPAYGGGPGHRWLLSTFLPRLLDEGLAPETIQNFMVHNPAAIYSFAK